MSDIYDPKCAIHGTPLRDGHCQWCTASASGAVPISVHIPVPAAPAPSCAACGHAEHTQGRCVACRESGIVASPCVNLIPAAPAPEATREADDTLIRLLAVWVNYKQGSHLDVTLPQNVSRALLAMLQDGDVRLVRESEVAAQARENEMLRAALERARTLIDRAMGDTDPLDEDDPLLVACQAISAALATRAPEPQP